MDNSVLMDFTRHAKIEIRLVNGETHWAYLDEVCDKGIYVSAVTNTLQPNVSPWSESHDEWDTVPRFYPNSAFLWMEWWGVMGDGDGE